jgi:lipoprotein NlpI
MFNRSRFQCARISSVELAIVASLTVLSSPIVAAQQPRELLERAVVDFERGRITESAAGFDALIKLRPDVAPELWQRGITLYYAGRYADCRAQFELHRTVNPNDVENAAWHFLCVARAESAAKARAALLPVGPDARVPMREVYDLFRGALTPDAVLKAAGSALSAQFYAHLYLGLYFEALGDSGRALDHISTAAEDRFTAPGGYMHTVAKIHLGIMKQRSPDVR